MYFKKAAGKLFGVEFNKNEQKIVEKALGEQWAEMGRQYEMDQDSSVLWMLHEQFGFGRKKLYRAWKRMHEDNKKLQDHYEMGPEDGGWLCRQKLKQYGVDLERWYKDEGIG